MVIIQISSNMKTIKERARRALGKLGNNSYVHGSTPTEDAFVDGYIVGTTEQKKIGEGCKMCRRAMINKFVDIVANMTSADYEHLEEFVCGIKKKLDK